VLVSACARRLDGACRLARSLTAGALLGLAAAHPASGQATVETVAARLDTPWALAFAADGRLFVTERAGRIRLVVGGRLLGTPVAVLPVVERGESGLMGLALDPVRRQRAALRVLHGGRPRRWSRQSRRPSHGSRRRRRAGGRRARRHARRLRSRRLSTQVRPRRQALRDRGRRRPARAGSAARGARRKDPPPEFRRFRAARQSFRRIARLLARSSQSPGSGVGPARTTDRRRARRERPRRGQPHPSWRELRLAAGGGKSG
jgi:Glucose / Sorbosone dehydrogenase